MKNRPALRCTSLSLPACLPTVAALLLVLAFPAPPLAAQTTTGVFSNSGALGTTDQTANVGLSGTKTYLEAIDLGNTVNTTVNGVLFTGSGGGANPSGAGWAFTNAPSVYTGGGALPGGALGGLTNKFIYGGTAAAPSTLTLSGLTVGQTYTLTFYNRSWEAAGARVQTINASGASTAATTFDEDIGATGQGNLNLLRYTFLAGSATQTLTIAPTVTNFSFHLYAFTNEQVFNNSWVSGSNWTTATWGTPGQPILAGSNANFSAQAAPTTINLDAARTVGHLQFDGANAWTLSGANTLTLQGDVGGVSVLSTLSGSHTISAPVVLASDTVKFGTGALTLSGAVSGAKGLSINAGTVRFGTSNNYTANGATTINSGAFLDLNGTNQTIAGALTGSGTILNNATGTSVLSLSSGNLAGTIRDNDNAGAGRISVVKTGTGTLTLSGANTFTEELAVTAGILNVASLSDYGVPSAIGARTAGAETAVGNGIGLRLANGTLQYTGATAQSTNRQIRMNTGTSYIDASGSVPAATLSFTYSGANTNFFQNGGARTLVLTGTNTGANTFAIKLDQTGGQTTLQKTGAGTWFVTNPSNAHTGETIIGSGILNVASVSDYGVPSAIGARTFAEENTGLNGVSLHFTGGTLQYTGATAQSTNRNIRVLNGNGATIDASGSVPEATLSFTHTGANMNLFDTGGTRTITLTGTNTGANGFSIQLTNQATNATSLTKSGVGTWSLNGPDQNDATGTTTVLGGMLVLNKTGVRAVSGPLTIGNGSASAIVQLSGSGGNQIIDTTVPTFAGTGANAARLQLANTTETTAGLSSTGGAGIVENESGTAGTGTLTVNVTSAQSFSGLIRDGDGTGTDGSLALTKTGAATQTLTGALSYTGATVIDGGRLQLDGAAGGSLATSSLAVNPGATLGFTANAASILTLNSGSTLTFNGGTVNFDLASVTGTDRIAADTLTFTANTNFTYTQIGALDFNQPYTLVSYSTLNNGGGFSIPATSAGRLMLTPAIDSPNNRITLTATLDNAVWSNAAGANWGNDLSNWTGYNPNASGDAALFGAALTTSGTVTVDAAKTVGYLSFDNATASYTIGTTGSSNLTLNSGGTFAAQIINSAGSHFIAENVALASDATVVSSPGTTTTLRGVVSGAKTLTKTGPGTLVLANTNNAWSAGTTVAAGTLQLGDGTTDGTVAGNITNNATVNFNNIGALTFGGVISGSGALTKTSGGTLTLTTANTFTGGTTVTAGTLDLGGGTAAGSVPGTITNDATLRFSRSGTVTIDTVVNGTGTTIISGGGVQNLAATTAINTPNVTIGDALLGFVYCGAPNQFNGTTGVLLNIGTHGSNSRINLNGFNQTVAGLTGTGIVQNHESAGGTPAATFTINVPGANSYSWTGLIRNQNGGALGLTKTGTGEQIMNFSITNPTYSGPTTVSQGRLIFGSTIGGTPTWNTSLIDVNAGAEVGLTGAGAGVVSWSEGKTISGAGSLVRTGADTNTVSITNNNNTFTGYTKLSGTGTLAVAALANIGAASSIGAGNASNDATNAASLVFDGGILRYTGGPVTTNRLLTLTPNGGTLDASGSGPVNFNHPGSVATSGSGPRTLILTGINTGNNTLTPALGDGTGGTTSVTKSSTGTWVLTGASSYTGATTVNGGRLQFEGSAATGTLTTSDLTISTGGSLGFTTGTASTLTLGSSLTLNGGTATFDAGAGGTRDQIAASALNLTANSTVSLTNPYTLGLISLGTPYTVVTYATLNNPGGSTVSVAPIGRLIFTPDVGTNAITVTPALDSAEWNNVAGGAWGTGPWTGYTPAIAGDAPLFGTTLAASDTVTLESAKAAGYMTFDNATASYTIGTAGSGNLTLSNVGTNAAAIFVKAGSHTITENTTLASDLFVSTDTDTTLTVNGTLNGGTKALGKLGPGTLKLTANNTFSGSTKINEGTLEVGAGGTTGTLGSGTVSNNGTLVWNNTSGIVVQAANAITGTGALTIRNGNINVQYNLGGSVCSGTITVDGTGSTVAPSFEIWTNGPTVTLANNFILNSMGPDPARGAINHDGGAGPVVLNGSLTLAGNSRIGNGGSSWNSMTANGLVSGVGKLFIYERPESNPSTQTTLTNSLNDYAGGTEIEKGRLRITQATALGTGAVTITGAQSQLLVDLDVPGTIPNDFTLGGGGNPTSTNYAFGNGTMVFQNDGQTTTLGGNVTLSGNAKIRSYSSGETVIFSQTIGGTGDLIFEAGGGTVNHNQTWSLAGSASTFAGNVLLRSDGGANATLRLDGGALPATAVVTLEDRGNRSAVLDLNGQSQTLAGLARITAGGLGSFITNGNASPATLTIDSANNSTFSGAIGANTAAVTTGQNAGSNDIALVKAGSGTFTLTGTNTYTGATTVNAGRLILENSGAFASPITVNSIDTDALTFNQTGGSATFTPTIAGTGAVTKSGTGTLTLTGALNHTGPTTVSAGRLLLDGTAATGSLATSDLSVGAGGTLGFTAATASTLTLGATATLNGGIANFDLGNSGVNDLIAANTLAVAADSTLSFNLYQLGIPAYGSAYTVATYNMLSNPGSFTVTAPAVGRLSFATLVGANAITVTPNLDSTEWNNTAGGVWGTGPWTSYTPTLTGDAPVFGSTLAASDVITLADARSAGFITFDNAAASYTLGAPGGNSLTLANTGTNPAVLHVKTGSHAIAENVILASDALVRTETGTTLTLGGVASGAGKTLTKTGPGTLVLTGANTFTGVTTISTGTLQWGDGTANGSLAGNLVNNSFWVVNSTTTTQIYGGQVSGTGSLVKNGDAILQLTNANTFTGGVTVNAGTIEIGNNGALGSQTAVLTINGGGVRAASAPRVIANPTTVGGSFVLGRLTDFSNTVTLGANATITANNYDGPANNNSRFMAPITGPFRVTFAEGLQGIGTGALVIEALNTNNGGTTVASGRVNVAATGALAEADLTVNGGILNLNNAAQTVTSLSGSGGTINLSTGHVLTVDQSDNTAYSGTIAGTGTLTKQGPGELTLSGSNTYTAATNVDEGTLSIGATGSLGNTAVTVASGATLAGTGTISGSTTISGIHAPGNSAGIQTFSNSLAYAATSSLQWQLMGLKDDVDGPVGNFDQVSVTGGTFGITAGAKLALMMDSGIDFSNPFWDSAHQWTIADLTGGVTGDGGTDLFTLDFASIGGINWSPSLASRFSVTRVDTDSEGKNDVVLNWSATYYTWANGLSPALSPVDPEADPDGDGLDNATEYVLGSDPRVPNAGGLEVQSIDATDMVVTFGRVDRSETPDVTVYVQVSTDLVDWTTLPAYQVTAPASSGVTVTENGAAPDTIEVEIPKGAADRKFARIAVAVDPP